MITTGFETIFAALDRIAKQLVPDAIVTGLDRAAELVTASAAATTLYGNVTGATRAGTVTYVATPDDDGSDAVAQAVRHVEALNPGQSQIEPIAPLGADTYALVLTSPTTYLQDLITRRGGEQDWVGPTLEANAPRITESVAQAIGEVLR